MDFYKKKVWKLLITVLFFFGYSYGEKFNEYDWLPLRNVEKKFQSHFNGNISMNRQQTIWTVLAVLIFVICAAIKAICTLAEKNINFYKIYS